jgi:hypothetical protein
MAALWWAFGGTDRRVLAVCCRFGGENLHDACEAFSTFLHGLSEVRWRIAPRVPTRERYQDLVGEA